jgi:transketolase
MEPRDRFILSKGHAAPVLYSALAEAGYFGRDKLLTLRKLGSMLQGHPDCKKTPGVEVSTGSLGQGLSISAGLAVGLRGGDHPENVIDDRTVFCLLGDGEIQEGQVWEAAMFAAHEGLGNLVAIIDHNGLQIDGACTEVMCLGTVADKFRAFDWHVIEIDGHDLDAIHEALLDAKAYTDGPVVIVAHTIKGKGVSFMEGQAGWHGKAPSADEVKQAFAELGVTEGSAA